MSAPFPSTFRRVTRAPGRPTAPCIASPLPVALDQPAPGPSFVMVTPVKSARASAAGGGAAEGDAGGVGAALLRAGWAIAMRGGALTVGLGGGSAATGAVSFAGATDISTSEGGRGFLTLSRPNPAPRSPPRPPNAT